jgi:hypothetical protein
LKKLLSCGYAGQLSRIEEVGVIVGVGDIFCKQQYEIQVCGAVYKYAAKVQSFGV